MIVDKFPKIIEFQTHNRCNANCIICPYVSMNYKGQKMSDMIFKKIIDECVGKSIVRLIPYLNNEPFIDKNFIEKLKYIRKQLPDVEIEISTNVSLLDKDIIHELYNLNITELRLSIFGYSEKTHIHMMPGISHKKVFENTEYLAKTFRNSNCKISIVMIDNKKLDESEFAKMKEYAIKNNFDFSRWGFLDRATNVKNFSNNYYNKQACNCEQKRPLERMHILADGRVIFCCQDWGHNHILGNVQNNSIEEIWMSDSYNQYRSNLYNKKLPAPELCKKCILSKGCEINDEEICNKT